MRTQPLTYVMWAVLALFCVSTVVDAQSQTAVFGPETFTRYAGKPQPVTDSFFVQDTAASYSLIIRSGQNGEGRVTSAVVSVNGVLMAGPSDFNPQTGVIVRPVKLQQQNTISIELRGDPGTSITVTIQKGPAPAQVTVIDNKTDPLLLEVVDTDGRVIDYFGDRDAEGLPTFIYAVRMQSPTGEVTTFFFDEQERPIRMVAPNGVFFEITWLSNTSIALTATAPNGDQIDVPIDLSTQTVGQPVVSSGTLKASLNNLMGTGFGWPSGNSWQSHPSRTTSIFETASFPAGAANAPVSATSGRAITQLLNQGESTSLVTVRHCGAPVDNAKVELEIRPERGDVQNYVYKFIGNGTYSLTIPNRDTGGDRQLGNRLCFALTKALDNLCNGIEAFTPAEKGLLCTGLSLGAALLGVPPPIFEAACLIIAADLDVICPANSLLGEFVCEGNRVLTNRIVRGRLSRNITATMPGASFPEFDTLGTPVNGVYPPVTLVFPCQCQNGYGKRFLVNENHTKVKVTIQPFEAAFTDEIWLFNGGRTQFIGTNREVGKVVNLGEFNAGDELVFGIRVRETGQTFRMGPGYRNPDRYAHDKVLCLGDGVKVSFEDNLGLGDHDFDDAVFKITTSQ